MSNKPRNPAIDPNSLRFDPNGNRRDDKRISREVRALVQGTDLAERERLAEQAREEAEMRADGGDNHERDIALELVKPAPSIDLDYGDPEDVSGEFEDDPLDDLDTEDAELARESQMRNPLFGHAGGIDAHHDAILQIAEDEAADKANWVERGASTPELSGEFKSYMLGDEIRVIHPLTGEETDMALVAVTWDDFEDSLHISYRVIGLVADGEEQS